jgi:hypothetical protein
MSTLFAISRAITWCSPKLTKSRNVSPPQALFASPLSDICKPQHLGFLDFGGHQVFAVGRHFVQCWGSTTLRNTSDGAGRAF